jgi:hypothetical protein
MDMDRIWIGYGYMDDDDGEDETTTTMTILLIVCSKMHPQKSRPPISKMK